MKKKTKKAIKLTEQYMENINSMSKKIGNELFIDYLLKM